MIPHLHSKKTFILLLIGLLTLGGFAMPAKSEGLFNLLSKEVSGVFEKVSPAIVKVRSSSKVAPLAGTGFFIDGDGTILTSATVVGDGYNAWVEYKDNKYQALVIGRDMRSNVAVLRIDLKSSPKLEFADSDHLKTADGVISVAYPFNLPATPNFGMVAGFDVQYLDRFFATTHIRASINVSPGQIGGPLLDSEGKVVGMMVMAIDGGKSCYALPSNSAAKIIKDMIQDGRAKHGWVGVGVVQDKKVGAENENTVVRVSNLFKGTPAAESGIKEGDEIISIGGRKISRPSDILDAAFFSKIGEQIAVVVKRDGQLKTFAFSVQERPEQSRLVQPIPEPDYLISGSRESNPGIIQVSGNR